MMEKSKYNGQMTGNIVLHPELKDLIESGEVNIGDKVWICDYRFDDPTNKPMRNIAPQQVFIMDKSSTKKRIYYSDFYFAPISAKGTPLATVIAPFDNTGFRGYTGISVNVFLDEKDCREHFVKQCEEARNKIVKARDAFTKKMNERIEESIVFQNIHANS